MKTINICLLGLAVVAAAFYLLLGFNVISVPTLNAEDAPPAITYVAAGCYIAGGLLILAGKRWLWIVGLVVNTMVIGIFFTMYSQQPQIMFSLPGLGTKVAQVLLEAGLVYLIFTYRKEALLAPQV